MIKAWTKALMAHSSIMDNIYFKIAKHQTTDRQDNIVIYVASQDNLEDYDTLLNTFKTYCGEGVLATKEDMPLATQYESDGISRADDFMLNNIYADYKESGLVENKNLEDSKNKLGTQSETTLPSYNEFVTKLFYTAVSMARQKHTEIPADAKLKDNADAMRDVKLYFSDLLRLSGMNPETMKHTTAFHERF